MFPVRFLAAQLGGVKSGRKRLRPEAIRCVGLDNIVRGFSLRSVEGEHRLGRRLQIFDRTGPGVDHPVYSNCLESRYLKVLWSRVV